MKRIILVVLACVLVFSSFMLTACDSELSDAITDTERDTQTETEKETEPKAEILDEPVPHDLLNGKNPRQVVEEFLAEFRQSKNFDMALNMRETEDGVTTNMIMSYKLTPNSVYVYMKYDDEEAEAWFVNNVVYYNMDEEKYKIPGKTINDVYGEGFIENIMSTIPDEFPETYLEKLEDSQFYFYQGMYYVTVTVSDSEAQEMGEEKGYRETLYFDADGKVKKIVDDAIDYHATALVNSYGKPISIAAPTDAHRYVDPTAIVPGDQDPQACAKYIELCDTLDSATMYRLTVDEDNIYEVSASGNKKIITVSDGEIYKMWYIDDVMYVQQGEGDIIRTEEPTPEMLSAFDGADSVKDSVAQKVSGNVMNDLALTRISADEYMISVRSDGGYVYKFTFDGDMSYITLSFGQIVDGETEEILTYSFDHINDTSFRVQAPSI